MNRYRGIGSRPTRRGFVRSGGAVAATAVLAASRLSLKAESGASDQVSFGWTDLRVSRLCQGTAFRQTERSPDNLLGQRILHKCLDLGVNFFDSSNAYGWGGAEAALGKAIRDHPRDRLVICTKVHPGRKPEGDGPSASVPLTREFAVRECEGSLKRLGTDYVDLYILHNQDPHTQLTEIADTMDVLVRSGKVRYWGVANHTGDQVGRLVAHVAQGDRSRLAGLQNYFNIIGRHTPEQAVRGIEQELFPLIRRHNLGLMAFSPLAGGDIAPGKSAPVGTALAGLLKVLDEVAGELGVSRAQVCIAWVLTHPEVTSSLAGAERPEHVEDNVAGSQLTLPAELLAKLNAASGEYMRGVAGRKAGNFGNRLLREDGVP